MLKKFLRIFFFTASLTFAACSNITSAPDEQRESTTQTTGAILSGRLIVNGALPSASSGTQSARTAFPTVPESFTYRVTAKKGSETTNGTVDDSDSSNITYSISFPSSGNWTVTAEALSSSTVFLSASATVDAANDSGKNFLLRYPSTSTSGTGTVNLKISYANTIPVNSIAAKMVGVDTATVSVNVSSFTNPYTGYKTFTYARSSVPLGPHKLTVYFKDSSGQTIYYLEQIVNVYKGFETNKFYGNEPYIDLSSGEIKLEASHLSSTQLTTFYVHGTNGTATGTGSIFSPVKTLGQAANLVNNSTATPAAGSSFKIILQTNTTESSDISLTKDVEIISDAAADSSAALRTVTAASGENVTITSSADLVSLENIAFASLKGFVVQSGSSVLMDTGSFSSCSATDGGALCVESGASFYGENINFTSCSATDYGGAIYSEGNIELDTCSITGCSAGHGGAIFAKNCGLELDSCTISGNSSTSEAGAIQLAGESETNKASLTMNECIIGTETPSALASATKDECLAAGGNYSSGGGGGILLGNYSTLESTNSKINGNYSGGAGGGINAGGTSSNTNVTLKITGGEICYNRASSNSGGGLQVYSKKECESYVEGTKIQYNHSNSSGGGISVTTENYFTVKSCTEISGNTSSGAGKGCYAAGNLILSGSTYIADGIYLNKNDTPLLLASDFELSGTNKIPLSYRTTESTQFTTGNILLNGANSNSITAEQCAAFELADDAFKIRHDTLASPNTGILAEASAGTLLEVGSGKTFETLKAALEHIYTYLPEATSEEDGYEIKICEDLTLTENLEISVPYVKITSDDDTTHRSISGGDTPTYGVKVTAAGVQFDKVDFTALLGGINVASGDLTLNNSKVENGNVKYTTSIENYAAGITVQSGATLKSTEGLIIKGCDNNTEANGHSGIYNNGGTIELTGTEITDCDNSKGSGGAIYCKGSTGKTILTNCNIHHNSTQSSTNGGAIYCYNGAEVELKGTTAIHDNTAWESTACNGGGIAVSNGISETNSKFTMESTVRIYNNKATGGHGGGIYVASGTVKLILDSSAPSNKDTGNETSTTEGSALCYISSNVTILSGSNINGTSYDSDTTLSDILKRN
jgi:hypothetical protein